MVFKIKKTLRYSTLKKEKKMLKKNTSTKTEKKSKRMKTKVKRKLKTGTTHKR
jgi:hypothetical protein